MFKQRVLVGTFVGQRKWTDPPRLLPVIVIVGGASAFIFWAAGHYSVFDYSFFYTTSLAVFTGSLAASIALWVYGFLSEEGQKREWRHDMEMRYFEQIYGPLYKETKAAVESLRKYQFHWLHKWDEVKASEFGPFVDPQLASELDALQKRFSSTSDLTNTSYYSAERAMRDGMTDYFGTGIASQLVSGVVGTLLQDQTFMFDPDQARPWDGLIRNLRDQLNQARRTEPEKDIEGLLTEVKKRLLKDPKVQERVSTCRAILPAATAVHAKILERMKHPFE